MQRMHLNIAFHLGENEEIICQEEAVNMLVWMWCNVNAYIVLGV